MGADCPILHNLSSLTASFFLFPNISIENENIFAQRCCRTVEKRTSGSERLTLCWQREW